MNARGKRYHPVKPARSYSEQFSRLTDVHGLIIDDEARARYILSTVNYYRLTTYGKHLRRADNPDLFLPGVSLETLYSLYQFDMNLRHLLLPVLEFFEIQLRAKIAYQLAITYGSMGYMDAENFRAETLPNGSSIHKNLIGKFKNEVPIWVAVELFTFGMLGSLFDLMRENDQRAVSREYNLSPESLSRLIASAVDVRNICAHYNRLYNRVLDDQPLLPNRLRLYESDRLFPLLLAFAHILGRERVLNRLITGLSLLEADFPEADLSLCGFPEDWRSILEAEAAQS